MGLSRLPNATKAELLAKLPGAQIPESTTTPPTGDQWLHEVKMDGYRMMARIDGRDIRLVSRNGVNWTDKFADVLPSLKSLPAKQAILDGEMTVLAADGTTQFSKLRGGRSRSDLLVYYVFDVLYLDGWDLTKTPLEQRKSALTELLQKCEHPTPMTTGNIASNRHGKLVSTSECPRALPLRPVSTRARGW